MKEIRRVIAKSRLMIISMHVKIDWISRWSIGYNLKINLRFLMPYHCSCFNPILLLIGILSNSQQYIERNDYRYMRVWKKWISDDDNGRKREALSNIVICWTFIDIENRFRINSIEITQWYYEKIFLDNYPLNLIFTALVSLVTHDQCRYFVTFSKNIFRMIILFKLKECITVAYQSNQSFVFDILDSISSRRKNGA